mmetsp:Transcript_5907/g.10027  ORF Transcript_5907/g.10027 Transcript_5907/m.10027 type:complete len:275 (+) Transcript_5907:39-863(+)
MWLIKQFASHFCGADKQPSMSVITVTVTTPVGEGKVLEVPENASASLLRELVAASWGVTPLEVALVDNASGMKLFFGNPTPLTPVPTDLLFVRSSTWAAVPEDLHHADLCISEDKCSVEHSEKPKHNEACFLSSALVKGFRYSLSLRVGGGDVEGGFIGICRDDMTEWDYLHGLWFLVRKGEMFNDHFNGKKGFFVADSFNAEAMAKARADDFLIRMVLDTCAGALELWTDAGDLILRHPQEELATETSLRFAASFYNPGISVEILHAKAERGV